MSADEVEVEGKQLPCYATDHQHPPAPGKWMTTGMQALQEAFHKLAQDTEEASQEKRRRAFSVGGVFKTQQGWLRGQVLVFNRIVSPSAVPSTQLLSRYFS